VEDVPHFLALCPGLAAERAVGGPPVLGELEAAYPDVSTLPVVWPNIEDPPRLAVKSDWKLPKCAPPGFGFDLT
jgi:hypothetical protein